MPTSQVTALFITGFIAQIILVVGLAYFLTRSGFKNNPKISIICSIIAILICIGGIRMHTVISQAETNQLGLQTPRYLESLRLSNELLEPQSIEDLNKKSTKIIELLTLDNKVDLIPTSLRSLVHHTSKPPKDSLEATLVQKWIVQNRDEIYYGILNKVSMKRSDIPPSGGFAYIIGAISAIILTITNMIGARKKRITKEATITDVPHLIGGGKLM